MSTIRRTSRLFHPNAEEGQRLAREEYERPLHCAGCGWLFPRDFAPTGVCLPCTRAREARAAEGRESRVTDLYERWRVQQMRRNRR